MKIPIFEEIVISDFSYPSLKLIFENARIGRVPSYINLSTIKKSDLITLIPIFEELLKELKLHPRFPYPTYLICQYGHESQFPIVRSSKYLPEHFFKKVKRPNNKELQLMNKLNLKVLKLNNLEINKIISEFTETCTPQRKLFELSKELYFLETIFDHVIEKPKK
jgi:hypothetical protein